jgi:acyl-coenzyme A synthetase/AMP-(fatty) acid ligase
MAHASSPALRDLTRLLCEGRPSRELVAFGSEGEVCFDEFRARVSALSARLAALGPGRFVLWCRDPLAFAVGIFGLAHAGCTAVLPPNAQPGTLRALLAGASGAVSDDRTPLSDLVSIDPLAHPVRPEGELSPVERHAPLLELFTSGSTGARKPIPKALHHFDDEAVALESEFGSALGSDTRVFGTVSFQHLYGLTFRLFWPLASGRPFSRDTPLHPEELYARLLHEEAFALATTPSHLRHLLHRGGALSRLRAAHRAVFCSAGPLDRSTALAAARELGRAPIEIFGSTETGAVGSRVRTPATSDPAFRPLPGVALACDPREERLEVRSPFVSVGTEGAGGQLRFLLGDRAELLADGGFRPLGRADRVVKIGDKRLALPDLEESLAASELVDEVALCIWSRGSAPRVGAVVVPSERGREELARQGRSGLARALRASLVSDWDAVLLPRAWRFVDALPRDAQGKIPQAELRERFTRTPVATARTPVIERELRSASRLERRLRIPPDLAHLRGHFPGFPLVPGVAQLGFALDAASSLFGAELAVGEIEIAKFRHVLRPGDRCDLTVELDRDSGRLRFELRDEDRVFSEGRLRVRPLGERA